MQRIVVIAVMLTAWVASADAAAEAAVLHAEALVAEMDGDAGHGLELLRQAIAIAPDDPDVAFELARLAVDLAGDTPVAASDVEPFLRQPATTSEERKLRAYLLAERNDLAAAAEELRATPAGTGGDAELDDLRAELGAYLDAMAATEPQTFRATLYVGGEGDTNVTLEPNTPASKKLGARLMIDASAVLTPFASLPRLQGALDLDIGTHVNGRGSTSNLDAYDTASGRLRLSFGSDFGPVETYVEATGSIVLTETFRSDYLHEVGGYAEARWPLAITPGVYVEAAWRDYVSGNGENAPGATKPPDIPPITNAISDPDTFSAAVDANVDYTERRDDRDGVHLGAGFSGEWTEDAWGILLRGGFVAELTDGPELRQLGVDASLAVPVLIGPLTATASFLFAWRKYPEWTKGRGDLSLSPRLDIQFAITDWLSLRASYFLTVNESSGARRFLEDYYRTLDQLEADPSKLLDPAWRYAPAPPPRHSITRATSSDSASKGASDVLCDHCTVSARARRADGAGRRRRRGGPGAGARCRRLAPARQGRCPRHRRLGADRRRRSPAGSDEQPQRRRPR